MSDLIPSSRQILPPRRDVLVRPEEGSSLRSQLVRLMTSPVLEVKMLAAHLLFVLCKEDGKYRTQCGARPWRCA